MRAVGAHLLEPGADKPHVATVRLSETDLELTVHVTDEISHPPRVWQHPNGSLIAVDGEIFTGGESSATISLSDLLERLSTDREATLASLNSAAAILTWNAVTQELCVARDRYGAAHVFYAETPQGLIVATDIQSIWATGIEGSLDPQALDCFLARGFVPAPITFFKQIRKLGPAQMLRMRPGEALAIESYFRPTVRPRISVPRRDRQHGIKTRLMDAVAQRLPSSGPTGVLLSSGIDSSLVLACAHALGARPKAFTFHYTDYSGPFNEGEQARALADHFKLPHQLLISRPRDIIDRLPILAANYGEPLTYGLHTFMLGAIKEYGISTALTGVGSDCFGISESGFAATTFQRLPSAIRKILRQTIRAGWSVSPRLAQKTYATLWSDEHSLPSCLHPALMPDTLRLALSRDPDASRAGNLRTLETFRRIAADFTNEPAVAAWRFTGQRCFGSEGALFWNQIWSRAANVELRHPFYDNALQDYVMRIGGLGRGKLYFRQLAAEMLPPWAARTPKLHHTIPIGHWFRGPLREMLEDYLSEPLLRDHFDTKIIERLKEEHVSGEADHTFRLWALVSFVAWHTYVLKPAKPQPAVKSPQEQLEPAFH
jgi:asparagine synthase (glutamine-hydrolysing)